MIKMTREGLTLTSDAEIIPAQGSADVPVQYINDTDTYKDYIVASKIGWYKKNSIYSVAITKYSSRILRVPTETFGRDGTVFITIKIAGPKDAAHIEITRQIAARCTPASSETVILPSKDEWQKAVADSMKQYMDSEFEAPASELVEKQKEQIAYIQNALDTGEFIGPRGPQGMQGIPGEKGEREERGDSGVITPANSVFTSVGDTAGDLYCYYADSATLPTFEADENGNTHMGIPGQRGTCITKALVGNFKGPKGDTGKAGPVGPRGSQRPQGNPGTVNIADDFVTGDSTYALSAPKGKELYDNLLQISNPNLLISGGFQVWQKGNEFNTTSNRIYTTDRWIAYMNASDGYVPYTITNSSRRIKISSIAGECKFLMFQHVELNSSIIHKILGKKLTLGMKIISSNVQEISTPATVLYNSSDKPSVSLAREAHAISANRYTIMKVAFDVVNDADFDDVKSLQVIFFSPGITSNVYIDYVKLGLGEIATPLVPRPYTEKLMLCQRYGKYIYVDYTMNTASNSLSNMMSIPADMRIDPALTLRAAGALTNVTGGKITHASFTNRVRLSFSTSAVGMLRVYDREYRADAEIY